MKYTDVNTMVNNCLLNLREQYLGSDGNLIGYVVPGISSGVSSELRDEVAEEY